MTCCFFTWDYYASSPEMIAQFKSTVMGLAINIIWCGVYKGMSSPLGSTYDHGWIMLTAVQLQPHTPESLMLYCGKSGGFAIAVYKFKSPVSKSTKNTNPRCLLFKIISKESYILYVWKIIAHWTNAKNVHYSKYITRDLVIFSIKTFNSTVHCQQLMWYVIIFFITRLFWLKHGSVNVVPGFSLVKPTVYIEKGICAKINIVILWFDISRI